MPFFVQEENSCLCLPASLNLFPGSSLNTATGVKSSGKTASGRIRFNGKVSARFMGEFCQSSRYMVVQNDP